ncbi:hypothetical protein GMRT_11031 [Giardia muris]|uniref:Uncharacterized protein n=1 Tax=Giardia muris TaxID=5742 RepID=A0A4Z1T444_GIAMU|nr:hypothetical protein GMRT_11031 [Giardia muris]|eukprot:TNJ27181.1 hypothetical protein GMRT_11031 [Giardia muris]
MTLPTRMEHYLMRRRSEPGSLEVNTTSVPQSQTLPERRPSRGHLSDTCPSGTVDLPRNPDPLHGPNPQVPSKFIEDAATLILQRLTGATSGTAPTTRTRSKHTRIPGVGVTHTLPEASEPSPSTPVAGTTAQAPPSPISSLLAPLQAGVPILIGAGDLSLGTTESEDQSGSTADSEGLETLSGQQGRIGPSIPRSSPGGKRIDPLKSVGYTGRLPPRGTPDRLRDKRRPNSANSVAAPKRYSVTTKDRNPLRGFKTQTISCTVFPWRQPPNEEVAHIYHHTLNQFRLTSHIGNAPTHPPLLPMLELRPYRNTAHVDFTDPNLSGYYEIFIAGVQDVSHIDRVGALSTLINKMISRDPTLFTLPSIALKEVDLQAMGYPSEEHEGGRTGLIIAPIRIPAEALKTDVNFITRNFIQKLSFFRCDLTIYKFGENPDLAKYIERIEVLQCGLATLGQLQFLSAFLSLRHVAIFDSVSQRPHFRGSCLYYCPTLESINDTPILDTDRDFAIKIEDQFGPFCDSILPRGEQAGDPANQRRAEFLMRRVAAAADATRRELSCATWIQFKK